MYPKELLKDRPSIFLTCDKITNSDKLRPLKFSEGIQGLSKISKNHGNILKGFTRSYELITDKSPKLFDKLKSNNQIKTLKVI